MNGWTSMAILKWRALLKAEVKAENLRREIDALTAIIPNEDLSEYMQHTEGLRDRYSRQQEIYEKRLQKRIMRESLMHLIPNREGVVE